MKCHDQIFGSMKVLMTLCFVILYMVALLRPAYPLVEYYMKLDQYKQACINKERPQLQCNGQCILMQRLRALNQENQTPVPPTPGKVNFEDYPVSIPETTHRLAVSIYTDLPKFQFAEPKAINIYLTDVFRPPCARS